MDYNVEDAQNPAEQARAKAQANLARQAVEVLKKQELLKLLPENLPLPVTQIHAQAYKADGTLVFEMSSREEALALLGKLPAVPVVLVRGATVAFVPKERATASTSSQSIKDIASVFFTADGYGGGYIREGYRWWTKLGDKLVHIKVNLEGTRTGGIRLHTEQDDIRGTRQVIGWFYHGMPPGESIRWAGADTKNPGELTVYWYNDQSMLEGFLSRTTLHKAVRSAR